MSKAAIIVMAIMGINPTGKSVIISRAFGEGVSDEAENVIKVFRHGRKIFYAQSAAASAALLACSALLAGCQQEVVRDDSVQAQFENNFPQGVAQPGNGAGGYQQLPQDDQPPPGQFIYEPVVPGVLPNQ